MAAGAYQAARKTQSEIVDDLVVKQRHHSNEIQRKDFLNGICSYDSFELRFAKRCLIGIEVAIADAVSKCQPIGEVILNAIRQMSSALVQIPRNLPEGFLGDVPWERVHHPVEQSSDALLQTPFYFHEAARYAIKLGDIVESIPIDLQSFELFQVAKNVLGPYERTNMLRGLLEKDPAISRLIRQLQAESNSPIGC